MPISIMMSVIAISVIMPSVIVLRVTAPLLSQTYYTSLIKNSTAIMPISIMSVIAIIVILPSVIVPSITAPLHSQT
jgi:hypothetical protein